LYSVHVYEIAPDAAVQAIVPVPVAMVKVGEVGDAIRIP
jgi:hypothetical protein